MEIIGHLVHFVHIFVRTPRDFWRKVSGSSPRFQASAMCTSGHAPDRPTAGTRTKLSSTREPAGAHCASSSKTTNSPNLHRQIRLMSKRPLSSSISPSSPSSRLKQVNNHTMGSAPPQATESMFNENVVPQAAEDPLFGLARMYKADTSDKKVDLGIGAYRDNNAKPWILPVVKKVGQSP